MRDDDILTRAALTFAKSGVRYFGPDDGHPRHAWCRATGCISCGCVQERPCTWHSEAYGYRDWVKPRTPETA